MILLIGATGVTGRETASGLSDTDIPVRALVRNPARAGALEAAGFELHHGDASDSSTLRGALQGVDTVFVSTTPAEGMAELHNHIVDAAKATGARRIVKVSAAGAHPGAKFRFAAQHGISDRYLQASGLAYTILRPVYFMQNFFGSAAAIAQMNEIQMPIAGGKLQLIDTRDIGAVAAAAMTGEGHDNKIYDLTGADSMTGSEMAAAMTRAFGREIRFVSPDPEQFGRMLLQYGVPEWSAGGILEMFALHARGVAGALTEAVQNILGRPPIRFEQFLRDHASAFSPASATA